MFAIGLIRGQDVGDLMLTAVALVPVAVIVLVLVARRGELTFGSAGIPHALALASAGVVTAIPLLLFAAAARRVPLVTIGLLQFATPLLQLLAGVLILREPLSLWLLLGAVLTLFGVMVVRRNVYLRYPPPPPDAACVAEVVTAE